jgi:hypothetical protein
MNIMMRNTLARAAAAAVMLVVACTTANAFVCPAKIRKPLVPLSPTVKLQGVAEISECFGNSFIYIKVKGRTPAGTTFIPVFRSLNPLIGPVISMNHGVGEVIWEGVTAYGAVNGGLTGRVLTITDSSYVDLLSVSF